MDKMNRKLAAIADCQEYWDHALQRGEARLRFPDRNKAVAYRRRMYKFRKLLGEASPTGVTPYDRLQLKIEKNDILIVPIDGPEIVL